MAELNIAKTLSAKRRQKGITQDELANYIGVSKASVSKWETGQSYPDITFLPQLATYFNITIDELIDYKPQMAKEDIRKLYFHFAKEFSKKPFNDVMSEILKVVKKYYSCYPLLFQLGVLIVNHYELMSDDIKVSTLEKCIEIFQHVKTQCEDISLYKMANNMEATCNLLLSRPEKIIELLENIDINICAENNLLSIGYSMNGQLDKAKEILQSGIYQDVLNTLQNLATLLNFNSDNLEKANEIISRILALSEAFDIENLHYGLILSIYLSIAQFYATINDVDNCLSMLKKYSKVAMGDIYPIELHGDKFFDKIDNFLNEFDLGTVAPRDSSTIKRSIIVSVDENPYFLALKDNKQFKEIVTNLKSKIGG